MIVRRYGVSSAPMPIGITATGPGILSVPSTNHVLAQNAVDYSLNSASNPAQPSQYVVLYLTGQGLVDNAVPTGAAAPASPFSAPLAPVDVEIGGVRATIGFVGLAPGMVGVLQINVMVPDVPGGDQPLQVHIGDVAANLVFLSVQAN